MNSEQRGKLLGFIGEFEDLFDGTLGKWDTESVELDLKRWSKMFNDG